MAVHFVQDFATPAVMVDTFGAGVRNMRGADLTKSALQARVASIGVAPVIVHLTQYWSV